MTSLFVFLQSILSQYSHSDDQQRKEFFDSLFAYLEKEGVSVVGITRVTVTQLVGPVCSITQPMVE